MAQQQFNPVPDVTTHSDAATLLNSNFTDAENRLSALETNNVSARFTQQSLTSSAGTLTLDVSSGFNASVTLTEDVILNITGASAGDSGNILIKQDATGGWAFNGAYRVVSGIIGYISAITINEVGICFVTWYFDGAEYSLFVSDVS